MYKFGPQAYLELVKPNEKCQYPEMYEIYKVVSQKEQERKVKEKQMQEERKQKQNRNMQGNLALTFLFKD